MTPRTILRIEGAAALVAALYGYYRLGGPLWLLAVLALAPDLSMLGYLVDERVGSIVYNLGHTYTLPLALGAVGYGLDARLLLLGALIWAGHIGADRLVGYGLKSASGFGDTHLSPSTGHGADAAVAKPR
ncbi:MAG: DUF4260 domain-containing protein [Halobellus sp.]